MIKEITIPDISENVTSGAVVEVLIETGQTVAVDDPIIEFETDKAVVEIPSPYAGKITEILVEAGDELNVGDMIAKLDTDADDSGQERDREADQSEPDSDQKSAQGTAEKQQSGAEDRGEALQEDDENDDRGSPQSRGTDTATDHRSSHYSGKKPPEDADEKTPEDAGEKSTDHDENEETHSSVPAAPSVRRLARELGVNIRDVSAVRSSNRISAEDVKAYVKQQQSVAQKRAAKSSVGPAKKDSGLPDFSRWGEVQTEALSTVRRLTAENLSLSHQQVVPVTQFDEADITAVEAFINRHSDKVSDQGGKLTLTAVLVKISALALRRFPRFNASIDMAGKQLIVKKYVHIGMAVDTSRGLMVPVIRDADRKSITELAVEIVDLARRTRNKKLNPDEMEGGTFTISNQGGIGGKGFTPVVLWPQTAILGIGRSTMKPHYIDGALQPRNTLPLSLTYDHRVVDGADAARFISWLREALEHPLAVHLG
jgi:pyruvate dehydrogenase E2 component (dihydrolipoamide acetyltransferase)